MKRCNRFIALEGFLSGIIKPILNLLPTGIILIGIIVIFQNCKEKVTIPSLTTITASGITQTSALSGGYIAGDGGAEVTARGVCWSSSKNPTTDSGKTTDGSGIGSFTSVIDGLSDNTKYYIRAYAINSEGTSYGNEVSFTTNPVLLPEVTTASIESVTPSSAVSGGSITSDGGGTVSSRGVCWNISGSPTTADSKSSDGTGTGDFISNLTGLTLNTTYYVRAYATNSAGTSYGNEISFVAKTIELASLSTSTPSSIKSSSAISGGNIISDGGGNVTARGVCWSTTANPTTNEPHSHNGFGPGAFISNIDGLTESTLYYVRAYAVNSAGTSYGNQESFTTSSLQWGTVTDYDGNEYRTVEIGYQTWMAENLRVTKFSDGTPIEHVTNLYWEQFTSPAYCWYADDKIKYGIEYGALYNGYAVSPAINGNRNLCPDGWHVPSQGEFVTLLDYLGVNAGGKLKEKDLSHWASPNAGATNETGFSALPAGWRYPFPITAFEVTDTVFNAMNFTTLFWSTTPYSDTDTDFYARCYFCLQLIYTDSEAVLTGGYWELGFSVRCLKGNK